MAQTRFIKHPFSFLLYVFLSAVLLCSVPVAAEVGVRSASEIDGEYIDWIKKVADWQLTQSSWDRSVSWERGALFAGMMAAYEATKDETYLIKSREFAEKFNWRLQSDSHFADNVAIGQDYMELYFLDEQDPARYSHFKSVSDTQVANPTDFNCDISGGSETWWWCDALFMAPPGLVRLTRATGDSAYTDLMHMMWSQTQDCLYDTEDHLFFRDIRYFWPDENYNGEKVFWSRGNGWVIAGAARVLQYLPLNDPKRSDYITLLQEMSAKLADIQLEDGYWHSDLLSPERIDNPETSGTGFFTFGIAWGVNNGFLDEATYLPTITAGWEALKAAVLPNGLLGWVQPVGAAPVDNNSSTSTDVFGVGAYLLAGSEMQKYALSKDPMSIEYFESYLTDAQLGSAWIDGDTNGTSSKVTLGDYGDNFMELSYQNDASPYFSQVDYAFTWPNDFTLNDAYYLSVLVRGDASNVAESLYVILEDSSANKAVQMMTNTVVVQTAEWMELAFPLSDFTGVDLTQVVGMSIGVGSPDAASATGEGTVRIDNIRLNRCVSVQADFDGNCKVELNDFAVLAGQWLEVYGVTTEPVDPGTANLEAYWPLNEHYNDVTGNGYDATAGASVTWDAGYSGSSAYFDATNYQSYLECQNSTSMDFDQGMTVSAWIRSSGLYDTWASVVTKGVNAWRLVRNSKGTGDSISYHFNASGGGEYQANGSIDVLDGQWHHLAGVYDGNEVRLYIDGQLDASAAAGAVKTTSDPVYIGSRVNRTTDRNWTGNIDEVRIYNTALSEANILYLSDSQPVIQIDHPRPTDLVVDGMIDSKDLLKLLESWIEDIAWPSVN